MNTTLLQSATTLLLIASASIFSGCNSTNKAPVESQVEHGNLDWLEHPIFGKFEKWKDRSDIYRMSYIRRTDSTREFLVVDFSNGTVLVADADRRVAKFIAPLKEKPQWPDLSQCVEVLLRENAVASK